MIYFCCDKLRRNALEGSTLNGIDYLEVLDADAPSPAERQRTLFVHFVNPLAGGAPAVENIRIEGGERMRNIKVASVVPDAGNPRVLVVEVDRPGDFSIYTLRLVRDSRHDEPPDGFDPMLAAIDFSFKVECPTDFDCKPQRICPPPPIDQPDIDYLAKDYAGFRRLMLDRMASLMPQWRERNPADLGVAMVELLAFVGDYLSYQQDAVSTEAYLNTARRRLSVRRHARLVDYLMHDGCNARTWIHIQVSADLIASTANPVLPKGTPLLTRIPGQRVRLPDEPTLLRRAHVIFETMEDVQELFAAHNEMFFYTWGDNRCCLPKGTTRATLMGHFPNLKTGEVLIFEEVLGPLTGNAADADLTHRHALRLTRVEHTDASSNPLVDPLNNQQITAIEWDAEDALPFPLCISARTDAAHGGEYIENVSVARGNMALADHGWTVKDEPLGVVPQWKLFRPPATGGDRCREILPVAIPPRFRPMLGERPLTQAAPYDSVAPAIAAFHASTHETLPAIALQSTLGVDSAHWHPKRDLLNSSANAREFVAETENDGTTMLRFGDDRHGARPEPETAFTATYRVGNGMAGNVGAEAIFHVVTADTDIVAVRNPLPARGGVEPESLEDVRQRAPDAFRAQERAVTEADYAKVAERSGAQVQRAAATFRWTGSWHTVFLTIDRPNGMPIDDEFEAAMRQHVERYRMAGVDLEVDGPVFVSLEIEMFVCVKPEYFRSDVKAALLETFSNRLLPDGRRGVFHPDNFSFGQTVYLSRLYAAAQSVSGVASVQIIRFGRQGAPASAFGKALDEGKLTLNRLEIARLDNDRNFPERGVFRLSLGGGK